MLIGSNENAGGLGLQCKYLTARGTTTVQYVHSDSGIIGLTDCPVLRKAKPLSTKVNPLRATAGSVFPL
nr:putative outer membrane or exported [Raoultella sp. NCTC 9187]